MPPLLNVAKDCMKIACIFGLGFAFFSYVGAFGTRQSVVLAVLALVSLVAYRIAQRTNLRQQPISHPFWINIQPNWFKIATDFGLVDETGWQQLRDSFENTGGGSNTYHVLTHGITLTCLRQNSKGVLLYSNDRNTFVNEWSLREDIPELKAKVAAEWPWHDFVPYLYVKRSMCEPKKKLGHPWIPVIEFGLATQEAIRKRDRLHEGAHEIVVARLPDRLFWRFYDQLDWSVRAKVEPQADEELKEFGWTTEERDPDFPNWPLELRHEYFRVRYRWL
jgi:hypothetical protein